MKQNLTTLAVYQLAFICEAGLTKRLQSCVPSVLRSMKLCPICFDITEEFHFLLKFTFLIRECLFRDETEEDVYVMRPFPSIWNCGVVHPHGLDPLSGDVKTLQCFSRSLEILTYMRSESSRLGLISGK